MKKKFKDPTISREDLDDAIANGIKLALKEQQSTMDLVVTSAVRDAVDTVLIPVLRDLRADIQATNNSVKELRAELEALASVVKQTRDRSIPFKQLHVRIGGQSRTSDGATARCQMEQLTEKMTDMEDRSRRNNVGLPEGAEGSNAAGFLRVNLSRWIPSLGGCDIEIDQAMRVYDGRKNSDRPRTLIFRALRWHDRSEILKGARQAYPVKCTQDNVTLLFFPDFSPATTTRRKSFNPVLKKMTSLGLQPFLTYPAVIKLRHKGEQRMFDSPQKAEDFISSLSKRKTYAAALQGNGKTAATISPARREGLGGRGGGGSSCPGGDDGKVDMDACWTCFLLFLLSSLLLGYCPYISGTTVLFAGKTNTPFFFFGGD